MNAVLVAATAFGLLSVLFAPKRFKYGVTTFWAVTFLFNYAFGAFL